MDKEERLRRSKRLIKSMDSKTFQERATHFASPVTGEKARTYEGLKPGDEGYLEAMYKANGIKYTEKSKRAERFMTSPSTSPVRSS